MVYSRKTLIADSDNPINNPPATTPHTCQSGWTPYLYGCYKLVSELKTFDNASAHCQMEGGELMSVHSEAENSAAQVFARDSLPIWIGFRQVRATSS